MLGIKNASELAVQGGKPFNFLILPNKVASFTIDDSNGADTYYSEWIDGVGCYNELEAFFKLTAVANRDDETIDITVEKEDPHGDAETILTFTQYAAQGAGHKETKGKNTYLGLKWRVKIVAAGTFAAGTTFTFAVKGIAKKV